MTNTAAIDPAIKIRYSSEASLTIPDIKQSTFTKSGFSDTQYLRLKKWMEQYQISSFSKFTADLHQKFLLFNPVPNFIYTIGDISLLDKKLLAIVGPRKNSIYASQVLENLLSTAKQYDIATLSGMALGVDALCHKISIENQIPTIAVLGGGLKWYLDSRRRAQINAIVENGGLVISEFKLGLEPNKFTFPQRNRIISGLADVVFLPEATEKSGSLITAKYAIQMKKPLWVAPNSLFSPTSRGTNRLLAEKKAQLFTDTSSFLDKYFGEKNSQGDQAIDNKYVFADSRQKDIFHIIMERGEITLTELKILTQQEMGDLLNIITLLEIEGMIYEKTPGQYSIVARSI